MIAYRIGGMFRHRLLQYSAKLLNGTLVVGLMWLLAYWTWEFVLPHHESLSTRPRSLSAMGQTAQPTLNPDEAISLIRSAGFFGSRVESVHSTASSASSRENSGANQSGSQVGLKLLGVFADPQAQHAIAIIHSGETSKIVRIGDTIQPGIQLIRIGSDHVIVMQSGRETRLNLFTH